MMKTKLSAIFLLACTLFATNAFADDEDLPWSILGYFGAITRGDADQIFTSGFTNARLYSIESAYKLPLADSVKKYINLELAMNITYQTEPCGNLGEFNPMIMLRWKRFPWNSTLNTTVALGEGVSYATSIPTIEYRDINHSWGPPKRFINFLAFEITFAAPSKPQWQVVARLHHRSAAFGLYGGGNDSSNAVALGLRYQF